MDSIQDIIKETGNSNLYEAAKTLLKSEFRPNSIYIPENSIIVANEMYRTEQYFMARELYNKVRTSKDFKEKYTKQLHQKFIQCIYKDPTLSSEFKFSYALNEFKNKEFYSEDQMDCESYGILGAIYKRWYLYSRNISYLYLSFEFYQKGMHLSMTPKSQNLGFSEDGYCAVNAAFVSDMIASHLKSQDKFNIENTVLAVKIDEATKLAKEIREKIIEISPVKQFIDEKNQKKNQTSEPNNSESDKFWKFTTLLECCLGLKKWEEANSLIDFYSDNFCKPDEWKLKTFYEQIKQLYRFLIENNAEDNNAKNIRDVFSSIQNKIFKFNHSLSLFSSPTKVGLALSGGGFRASYFHLGVLAALAEKGKLKNIEVISCVSGGSILGAAYYLHLKKLLEQKQDSLITDNDYIELVEKLICTFHLGVQQNIRMRLFTNLCSNFKMAFSKNYSRSQRIAELFEDYLYKPILEKDNIRMSDLLIHPEGSKDFNIKTGNLLRTNKVPQLVINATTLNTGHNFQFTATWFGEPPFSINPEVNGKWRIRRAYYNDFPNEYRNVLLRTAVGASACVPALFMGVKLPGLIKDKEVKLVDGGVRDNQGITAIMEAECKEVIISDASGQMGTLHQIVTSPISEAKRSSDVSMEYIREFQLNDILEKAKQGFFDNCILVHLKKDVKDAAVFPENNNGIKGDLFKAQQPLEMTGFGISTNLQRALSEVRTDLDSFNDTEAYALMLSGYNQTMIDLGENIHNSYKWSFKKVINSINKNETEVVNIIKNGTGLFLKWLYPFKNGLKIFTGILLSILVTLLIYKFSKIDCSELMKFITTPIDIFSIIINRNKNHSILICKLIFYTLLFIGLTFFGKFYNKIGLKRPPLISLLVYMGLSVLFIAFRIYILFLNRVYNNIGSLKCD